MEISPKALREVEFREKLRGYHPEDVDEFVERVATGIEALQERLRQATERAVHAEQLAAESGEGDDAIKRTLVLAQRTADLAVEEAQEQAGMIIEQAQDQAREIVATARQEAEALAREAQAQLRTDLDRLSTARDQLVEDVRALEGWLEQHRSSFSTALTEALQRLEAGLVADTAPPQPAEIEVPPPVAAETAEETETEAEPEAAVTTTDGEAVDIDTDTGADIDADGEYTGEDTGEILGLADEDEDEDEDEGEDDDGGVALDEDAQHEHDDDPFMAELRRAVDDDEPLGPRDEDEPLSVPPGHERVFEDGPDGRRFSGRRRRRR